MRIEDLVRRADELILAGETNRRMLSTGSQDDPARFWTFRTASLSFLQNFFGPTHPYYLNFEERVLAARDFCYQVGCGILRGARDELHGGWALTTKAIVSAEVFSDFLEMASYLQREGYKDAAAVIAGSVLEEHLRQLCQKARIDIEKTNADGSKSPKKNDAMNADLAREKVYSALDLKQVTAWLDLRNKAAHGKYGEYTKEQVDLMLGGITNFTARVT